MNRSSVYQIIDSERDFQKSLSEKRGFSSNKSVGEYLTLIRTYSSKADETWTTEAGDDGALEQIRKIAALCVACMESHGAKIRTPILKKVPRPALAVNPISWDRIAWQPVSSSNIQQMRYNPNLVSLQIQFRDGNIYEYDGIPGAVYIGLVASPSKGKFFHAQIKGQYPAKKIA